MADEDEEIAAAALGFLFCALNHLRKKKRRRRRWWVHPAITERRSHGHSSSLLPILQSHDPSMYANFLRVSPELCNKLLEILRPFIRKNNTNYRLAIPAETRLHITLRCLATGESFSSLSLQFSVVGKIVRETCKAIWTHIGRRYVKFRKTPLEWQEIATQFYDRWQLPHCVGAIDSKHVRMQCPGRIGSLNFNYKHFFSKVLFAVAAADYKFIYVDVGNYGSEGDAGILAKSTFGKKMDNGTLNLPAPNSLPDSNVVFPYYFIGDKAFPLRPDLMRPFKGKDIEVHKKIFNYRLCRARRVVENAFGIMASRFRMFRSELLASEKTCDHMVMAAIALHNFCITEDCPVYCPPNFVDHDAKPDFRLIQGNWRDDSSQTVSLQAHGRIGSANYNRMLNETRNKLATYFMSEEGNVSWQNEAILRGYYM